MYTNEISTQLFMGQLDDALETFRRECAMARGMSWSYGRVNGVIGTGFVCGMLPTDAYYFWLDVTDAWMDHSRTEKLINGDIPDFLKRQAQ